MKQHDVFRQFLDGDGDEGGGSGRKRISLGKWHRRQTDGSSAGGTQHGRYQLEQLGAILQFQG